ncbi:putative e3 ubiquitin-protein ligase AMFR-like protein [Operophtera brumata]|uniref:Putative e3 ubiquitin-protein ligase AMFR-like protein n=1 Tax=Operophtera brumata TaxID=104452 RepID=A0A0L7L146_OPEBR|nr:putative e3 ubiquitin-protein ligase AMFR-like protein [Operophtera brumata]
MPVTLVDRLPLPNLKVYTAGSVLLLSVAVYYALNVTSDPNWKANVTAPSAEALATEEGATEAEAALPVLAGLDASRNLTEQFVDMMTFMMQEPLCMWVSKRLNFLIP